jgi:hypothetical protein
MEEKMNHHDPIFDKSESIESGNKEKNGPGFQPVI